MICRTGQACIVRLRSLVRILRDGGIDQTADGQGIVLPFLQARGGEFDGQSVVAERGGRNSAAGQAIVAGGLSLLGCHRLIEDQGDLLGVAVQWLRPGSSRGVERRLRADRCSLAALAAPGGHRVRCSCGWSSR